MDTKRKVKELIELPNGYQMFWSDVKVEQNARIGMAMIVKEAKICKIRKLNKWNSNINQHKGGEDCEEYTIIVGCGPNEDAKKKIKIDSSKIYNQ